MTVEHPFVGELPLSVARPEHPRGAGLIVIQEAFGVTSHIEAVCGRAAAAGYLAAAPHLFHRSGDPAVSYDDVQAAYPLMQALTPEGLTADLDATIAWFDADGVPPARLAIVGFCMGGSVALWAGAVRPLGAAITFYGGGVREGRFGLPPLIDLAPGLQAPWLGLFGDLDKGIPAADVEVLRTAAAESTVETEIIRYPDAQHGFHCDDRPAVFNPDAAADGWARTMSWLDAHLPS
ncbi:MAG TPA: dienelactone hydrolase family protein [Mycobacteriales bacterium]|jgi:carboxymethylenebutenolidase|nr:dienelactone hydrolase family protein [Mycobacteriales bacterium]